MSRKKSPARPSRIFDGEAEAKLTALACSEPHKGNARWSLQWRTCATSKHDEAIPAVEAKRIADRFEWHYTPKHGSWLNIAECELSALSGQCLDRCIPDKASLDTEVTAWTTTRNGKKAKVKWHFTTEHARTKLAQLYPQIG